MASGGGGGMELADLKRHLRLAKEEPIQVAFALGGDGKAVLQMHKRKPARALERQLKDEAPDSRNHRWGTATVSPDEPKLVRFLINKASSGMARRLVLALKGTGFNKVKLVLEDGTEEGAEGEPEEPAGEEDEPHAPPPPPPAEAAPAAEHAKPDPEGANLVREIAAAVQQLKPQLDSDPSQRDSVKTLVADAQARIKSGDLANARADLDRLKRMVGAGPAAGQGAEHANSPAIVNARKAWIATRKKVESVVDGLHGDFAKALDGHEKSDHITGLFRKRVESVLGNLDESLAHKLDEINKTSTPQDRDAKVKEAHALLSRYRSHIEQDETIALLDKNPFKPVAIRQTMATTLDALSKAIH